MLRILRRFPRAARRQVPNAVSLALTFSLLVSSVPIGPFAPLPAQALIGDLTQADYRWYDNADAVQPTTALAAENTAITAQPPGALYQLRMSAANAGNNIGAGAVFRLQFSTSTSGPWTDVGGLGSGTIWRGFDNPTPAAGVALPTPLVNSDHVAPPASAEANPPTTPHFSTDTPHGTADGQQGTGRWQPECLNNADCVFDCTGTSECRARCKNDSTCTIDCTGSTDCLPDIQCKNNAQCVLLCSPGAAATCGFGTCDGVLLDCLGDGTVLACHRACP